jgi:hypothetical protein
MCLRMCLNQLPVEGVQSSSEVKSQAVCVCCLVLGIPALSPARLLLLLTAARRSRRRACLLADRVCG